MKKQRGFILLFFLFLMACAPEANTLRTEPRSQVNELAVNNLVANSWCQRNTTTGATEYKWQFNKDLTATATKPNQQTNPETFQWSITSDNILTLKVGMLAIIFIKRVTYNYDVTELKRTMAWSDGEVTNFIECE